MIARLSDMTEEQRRAFDEYYSKCLTGELGFKLHKAAENFNMYGYRFDTDYLRLIGRNVIFLPLEIMADYCHLWIHNNLCRNPADPRMAMYANYGPADHTDLNAATIGNIAAILRYSTNEMDKAIAEKILNQIHAMETVALEMMEEEK